jgi:diguanylate cyclase (GGDEF)-like protein
MFDLMACVPGPVGVDGRGTTPGAAGARADASQHPPVHDQTDTARLASRSAQVLLFGAGLVTVVNSLVSRLGGVNVGALRVTGVLTMATSFLVPFLPWQKHGRLVSYGIVVGALAALAGTDAIHHYSRNQSAIAVYPVFFILIIAWAGLTQPRGTAAIVACLSGAALAWLLRSGGHNAAAWQCVAVTVPAAAMLGEAVSWSFARAVQLADLDAERRVALEALVLGTSRLQGALTTAETEAIVVETATTMFNGHDTRFEIAEQTIDDGAASDDAYYDGTAMELRIRIRGQSGVIGTLFTVVERPDAFALDAARLYSQHVGTRLEQLRVIDALTDAATHDALTGIGNRRAAELSIASVQAGDAIFLLDLDHFKTINDSLGHQTGDLVLAQFGDYLRDSTRPTDAISRYGGEEFLLISPATNDEGAQHLAGRLLDGWRMKRPLVTFSIGYAIHTEVDAPERTLEHADTALYDAKRRGRDRSCGYGELDDPHRSAAA